LDQFRPLLIRPNSPGIHNDDHFVAFRKHFNAVILQKREINNMFEVSSGIMNEYCCSDPWYFSQNIPMYYLIFSYNLCYQREYECGLIIK